MLLFVATFDMAHETVRSEALSDKLRSAARRLPPSLLDPGEACAQKAAQGAQQDSDASGAPTRGSAADATYEGARVYTIYKSVHCSLWNYGSGRTKNLTI